MPEYIYRDEKTGKERTVFHSISECDTPSPETLKKITYRKRLMKRVIFAPMLNGASGKSEKQLLQDKADYARQRAKAHTINEGYKDIKHADVRANIEKKKKAGFYDDVKGKDHDKMKI